MPVPQRVNVVREAVRVVVRVWWYRWQRDGVSTPRPEAHPGSDRCASDESDRGSLEVAGGDQGTGYAHHHGDGEAPRGAHDATTLDASYSASVGHGRTSVFVGRLATS